MYLIQLVQVKESGYTMHTQWVAHNDVQMRKKLRIALHQAGCREGIDDLIAEWDPREDGFLWEDEETFVLANDVRDIDEFCYNTDESGIVVLG